MNIAGAVVVAVAVVLASIPAKGQQVISTPCTSSMISTFTPCLNFVTGSSGGTSTPSAGCCESLKSLMNGGMDCACLIFTANVPLPLLVNRTLSLGLPRACNMGGIPVQCQAAGTPLPSPGPVPLLLAPPPPSSGSSPLGPGGSKATAITPAPAPTPASDLSPEAPVDGNVGPTTRPGIRPVVQPSTPSLAYSTSPPLASLLFVIPIFFIFRFC